MHDWIGLESLHVISDLHLGRREGFQIFGSTAELAWLIDRVAAAPQPGRHARSSATSMLRSPPTLSPEPSPDLGPIRPGAGDRPVRPARHLRNFGLKVGMVGTVKLDARIKELVEKLPDLAGLVEPLLIVRRTLREQIGILHRRLLPIVRNDDVCRVPIPKRSTSLRATSTLWWWIV